MRGEPSISPIYKRGQTDRQEDAFEHFARIDAMRRAAWRKHGFIAVKPQELPAGLAAQITAWAEDQYGKR